MNHRQRSGGSPPAPSSWMQHPPAPPLSFSSRSYPSLEPPTKRFRGNDDNLHRLPPRSSTWAGNRPLRNASSGYTPLDPHFRDEPQDSDDSYRRKPRHRVLKAKQVADSLRVSPSNTLIVRNLASKSNPQFVKRKFFEHGLVTQFDELISRRGIAFITYYEMSSAKAALEELHGSEIDGNIINIEFERSNANYKPEEIRSNVKLENAANETKNSGHLHLKTSVAVQTVVVDEAQQGSGTTVVKDRLSEARKLQQILTTIKEKTSRSTSASPSLDNGADTAHEPEPIMTPNSEKYPVRGEGGELVSQNQGNAVGHSVRALASAPPKSTGVAHPLYDVNYTPLVMPPGLFSDHTPHMVNPVAPEALPRRQDILGSPASNAGHFFSSDSHSSMAGFAYMSLHQEHGPIQLSQPPASTQAFASLGGGSTSAVPLPPSASTTEVNLEAIMDLQHILAQAVPPSTPGMSFSPSTSITQTNLEAIADLQRILAQASPP